MSIRKMSLLFATGSMLALSGCFGDDSEGDDTAADATVEITDLAVTEDVGTWTISGTITSTEDVTAVTGIVLDSAGEDVAAAQLYYDDAALPTSDSAELTSIDLEKDLLAEILSGDAYCNGSYTLQIIATAGELSDTATVPVEVTSGSSDCVDGVLPTGTAVEVIDITLGSWKASAGSSLEADAMVVLTSAAASAASSDVDVVYSNLANGTNGLYSPAQLATISGISKDWSTKNATQIATLTGVDFDAIKTQEEIDALWTDAVETAADQLAIVSSNDVIIIKTNEGKFRLLKVISGDGTDTGTLVAKGAIPAAADVTAD